MEHYNDSLYYAMEGEFVKIDGTPYVGPYHVMKSGAAMTGTMHSRDSEVIFSVKDRKTDKSEPLGTTPLNNTLDENQTEYDLLPTLVNNVPVIIKSMAEASTPSVKPSAAAGTLDGDYMYQFPDGTVKVHAGADITLRVEAEQPNVFNVENGVLEIIPPKQGLTYKWYLDGEEIKSPVTLRRSLNASRVISGSTLTITNMIPQFIGQYSCIVSNDIGSADGGSLDIEVWNSDQDAYFYTNLVTNPNGRGADGSLSLTGWESLTGEMIARQLTPRTSGERDKSISVDPMDQKFHWTREMMFPRPYQLNPGVLQKNPLSLDKFNSYFTRNDYEYGQRGEVKLAQIYQDIDLSELTEHIRGSIYGISGVTAMVSYYIGNAIYSYEPAAPFISPTERANIRNYYRGSARLSLENFIKMGPGFVKEVVSVTVEEYDNETRVPSLNQNSTKPIVRLDPWNARFPNYANQLYSSAYTVGSNYQPNKIDAHLFVADELFPTQQDRYTYGQYAEFQRIVLDRLNPRTTKIRITLTIKSTGALNFIINEGLTRELLPTKGIYETAGWQQSWKSGYLIDSPDGGGDDRPWAVIETQYRPNLPWPDNIEQKMPKQSLSRAFASGFNLTLIPTGSAQQNDGIINRIYSLNTSPVSLIESPVKANAGTFDPFDKGDRIITMTFIMDYTDNILGIQMTGVSPTNPTAVPEQIDYTDNLLPFDEGSSVTYYTNKAISAKSQTKINPNASNKISDITTTNGTLAPTYILPTEISSNYPGERFVQLAGQFSPGSTANAPTFPLSWYTIGTQDRIRLYNKAVSGSEESFQYSYDFWSLPHSPLRLDLYGDNWNRGTSQEGGVATSNPAYYTNANPLEKGNTQWKGVSRFVITLGVHNSKLDSTDVTSLYSTETYYLDISNTTATFHKDTFVAGVAALPGFDTVEQINTEVREALISGSEVKFNLDDVAQLPDDNSPVYSYNQVVKDMTPVRADFRQVSSYDNVVAFIELPKPLLVNSRRRGGLNIPTNSINEATGSLMPVNVVDGTLNKLAVSADSALESILTYNNNVISASLAEQIEPLYNALANNLEKAFFDFYNYTLVHNDIKQTQPISAADSPTGQIILRTALPEDSPLMVLGRRRYAMTETYKQLQARSFNQEDAPLNAQRVSFPNILSKVTLEALNTPTIARIFVNGDGIELNPDYKVILYGIRPAPVDKYIDTSAGDTSAATLIGTPLEGSFQGKTLTIKDIVVENTASLNLFSVGV